MIDWIRSLIKGFNINTLAIIVSTIIAVINLRALIKTQYLESVQELFKYLADTAEDREFVIKEFSFSPEEPKLQPDIKRKVENVINSLNRIGLLLESKLLPPKYVFGICHGQIIRCWYKLKDYAQYKESRIGERYGRRLARLATRAKMYHDINPQHRVTKIKIDPGPGQEPFIVYETTIKKGFGGIKQKICWNIRRLFRLY